VEDPVAALSPNLNAFADRLVRSIHAWSCVIGCSLTSDPRATPSKDTQSFHPRVCVASPSRMFRAIAPISQREPYLEGKLQ
jgi:hypothetical protein